MSDYNLTERIDLGGGRIEYKPIISPRGRLLLPLTGVVFGTFGTGVFGSRFDAANRRMTQRHASSGGADEVGQFRLRVRLPLDFRNFPNNAVSIVTRRTGAVDALTLSMFKNGTVDPSVNGVSILPVADATYETFQFTPSGVYLPGDYLSFEVASTVDSGEISELADFGVTHEV